MSSMVANADSGPGDAPKLNPESVLAQGISGSDEAVIKRVLSEHKQSRNPFIRGLWISFGSLAVIFAIIGIVVPGWPTTSWLVLAAYCYARSSQKLFRWLLTKDRKSVV